MSFRAWLVAVAAVCVKAQESDGWQTLLNRALRLHQTNQFAEAAHNYEHTLKHDGIPDTHRYQIESNLGLMLLELNRLTEAVHVFDEVLRKRPDFADGHHNRGNALYKSKQWGMAIDAFGTAVKLVPSDSGSWFNLGNSADKLGDYDQAIQAFRLVLKHGDPADPAALYNLANAHKAQGNTEEAVHHYRQAISSTPEDADKHANLAYTLDAADRRAEAIESFGAALRLNGEDAAVYTGLGHCLKSQNKMAAAAEAYKRALAIEPQSASAYLGLGSALKDSDPKSAAEAFAFSSSAAVELSAEAETVRGWLDSTPQPSREEKRPSPRYPEVFEGGVLCSSMAVEDAVAMGSAKLLAAGPIKLTNASFGWAAREWTDEQLIEAVGDGPLQMLAMPQPVHPTLDVVNDALIEPALTGVFFPDYLKLLDRLSASSEFAVYLAQLNMLKLPKLLSQVCLPAALPGSKLTMANIWVGGDLMKNGLHFDNFDNLLHQIRGRKRALLFPPTDTENLYYSAATIRRHDINLTQPKPFEGSGSHHDQIRHNVARVDVFAADVASTHPKVKDTSPMICELEPGDAMFLPKGWHHAVISHAPLRRNLAVNTWYDMQSKTVPMERVSALSDLFQMAGCP